MAQLPGNLNNDFSQNGWDTIIGNNNGFYVHNVITQPDEKILVCAEANDSNEGHQAVIIRYNTDGTLDMAFGGGDGVVRSWDDVNIDLYTRASDIVLQSNGKIIIVGDQLYNTERIIRLNTDGSRDSTFGVNGVADFNRPNSEFIYEVAVQSDDKIIVCGKETRLINNVPEPHVFLWRLTESGILDNSFGTAGVVSYASNTWLGAFEISLVINDIKVLPNDQILINQTFTLYPYNYVQLKRLNVDGTVDNTFGIAGDVIKKNKSNDGAYTYSSFGVQQNGAIISSISIRDTTIGTYTEQIFRVDNQGTEDISLNLILNNISSFPDLIKILVWGNKFYVLQKNPTGFNNLYCYDLSGNPVNNFGSNGIALINGNDIPDSYYEDMTITQSGKIYMSSSLSGINNQGINLFLTCNINAFPFETAVGISQIDAPDFYVSPSIADNFITIHNLNQTKFKYVICDILGRNILRLNNSSISLNTIDISSLPNGVYFIQESNNLKRFKFLVSHN